MLFSRVSVIAVLCVSASAYAARQDGLAVHLTFDDPAYPLRNMAPDGAGVEITTVGDAIAPTFGPGRFGRAAKFTAGSTAGTAKMTRDWAISLGRIESLYAGDFTVACWVNPTAPSNGMIFTNKSNDGISYGWGFSTDPVRNFMIYPIGSSGFVSPAALEPGRWAHVALVVDRSVAKARFYHNGVLRHEYALPSADAKIAVTPATMVGSAENGAYGVDALVDEVAIWKRALSPAEIESIGGAGKRIPEPSAYVWAGLGVAGLAAWARRRRCRAL